MKTSTYAWIRGCIKKKPYSDGMADAVIEKNKGKVQLYKYYCGSCGNFHLTKSEPRKKPA